MNLRFKLVAVTHSDCAHCVQRLHRVSHACDLTPAACLGATGGVGYALVSRKLAQRFARKRLARATPPPGDGQWELEPYPAVAGFNPVVLQQVVIMIPGMCKIWCRSLNQMVTLGLLPGCRWLTLLALTKSVNG